MIAASFSRRASNTVTDVGLLPEGRVAEGAQALERRLPRR